MKTICEKFHGTVVPLVLVLVFCHFAIAQDAKGFGDQSVENLRNAVALFNKAFEQRGFQTIIDQIDDKSIKRAGGARKFFELITMAWEPYPVGFLKVDKPHEISVIEDKSFAVLPLRMEGLITVKSRKVVETCLLAISSDDGKTWKFNTGESFFEIYPELVGKVKILTRKEIIEPVQQ